MRKKKKEVYSYPIFLYPGICEVSSGYFETFPREKFFARLPIFPPRKFLVLSLAFVSLILFIKLIIVEQDIW